MTLGIGCSPITGVIYAGNIREHKDGVKEFTGQRTDVTDEAVNAVISHLSVKCRDMDGGPIEIKGEFPNGVKFTIYYMEGKE